MKMNDVLCECGKKMHIAFAGCGRIVYGCRNCFRFKELNLQLCMARDYDLEMCSYLQEEQEKRPKNYEAFISRFGAKGNEGTFI
jgi:hypothetical protein